MRANGTRKSPRKAERRHRSACNSSSYRDEEFAQVELAKGVDTGFSNASESKTDELKDRKPVQLITHKV